MLIQLIKPTANLTRHYGWHSGREAVEDSLRLMVRLKRQERIRRARGKLKWTGDLGAMRRN